MTVAHLTRAGVSLVLGRDADGIPSVLHWGAALGDLDDEALDGLRPAARRPGVSRSSYDAPRTTGLVPDGTRGFAGTPALEGHRVGGAPRRRHRAWSTGRSSSATVALTCTSSDAEAGWDVSVQLALDDGGLLHARTSVTNSADGDLHLATVLTALPVGAHATELAGPHRALVQGALAAAAPLGARHAPPRRPPRPDRPRRHPPHGRRHPRLHLRHRRGLGRAHRVERQPHDVRRAHPRGRLPARRRRAARSRRGGPRPRRDLPLPVAARVVVAGRSRPAEPPLPRPPARGHAPRPPERPVIANTWEAVYFDQSLERLPSSPTSPPSVGVERFVLDDGWFLGRRDDTAGLGDWTVDAAVWPEGLGPAGRARDRPRDGVRPVGRARDGQPRLRGRAHPSRAGPARTRRRAAGVAAAAGARPPGRRGLRRPARRPAGTPRRPRHRLPQVGPQPRPHRRHPRRPTGRARADAGGVPTPRRAARRPPDPRDRVLLLRRRARRRRGADPHRPDLAQRHQRSPRAAAPAAVDVAARAAGADGIARGARHLAHDRPHPRAALPRGHRAAPLLRHRVGHDPPRRGRAGRAAVVDRPAQAGPSAHRHRHAGAPRPPGPGRRGHRHRRRGPLGGVVRRRHRGGDRHPAPRSPAAHRPRPRPPYRLSEELPPAGGADLSGGWSASGAVLGGRVLATSGSRCRCWTPRRPGCCAWSRRRPA